MTQTHPQSAVALIGMACRLPGADNIDQFWELARAGGTAWGPVPEERLNRRLYYHPKKGTLNKTYSDLAALVSYGPVDRQICPISDLAINSHDAAHVTLCEVAAAACRHAGFDPTAIPLANTGVYIGHAATSAQAAELTYATYIAQTAKYLRETVGFERLADGLGDEVIREMIDTVRRKRPHCHSDRGLAFGASLAAGLIAKTFALDGPCMSFNAACASSSRALVQAARALQLGNIDMAVVGGASYFHSDTSVLFAQSHSLSPNGSHPFSNEADGMIIGEGYVVMLFKMLARAVADGDRILAVVPSFGVSSDGKGKSLWAPRREGQVKAIERAYGPEVAIEELQYIEGHATSTSLGDITEIASLTEVLAGRLPEGTKIPIGSAKLNVGHTLEAAGLVGMLKAVLALEHEAIPPSIDDRPLNPQVDWNNVPLIVPRRETAWPRRTDGKPRRLGVDAFGIGGLNVHLVVDDYVKQPATTVSVAEVPTPASIKPSGKDKEPIAVVGRGAVMPGALTLEAFWDLLTSGRDARTDLPAERWDAEAFSGPEAQEPWRIEKHRGGHIVGFEYDWRKHKIPPKEIALASPLQFMILDAVDQAITRANYHERSFDRERTGVVVGTIFGGDCAAELAVCLRLPEFQEDLAELLCRKGIDQELVAEMVESYGKVLLDHMPILRDETGSFTASALASRITKSFDLMGGAVAVDAGGASSMAALACCVDLLRAGDSEMMICVGGHQDMTPAFYEQWLARGRLPSGEIRSPFDARSDGTVPAEGCGALLLKRLSDAKRDGDPIYGIIRGMGAAFDPSRAQSARLAISRAQEDAGVSVADVSLVETMATGQPELDAIQWQGLADAYGQTARARPVMLGSAVGQIGDLSGASGMASILKATMEIDSLEVPSEIKLDGPSPQLARHADVLQVARAATSIEPNEQQEIISGVHGTGEDETTYHVFLQRATKVQPKPRDKSVLLDHAQPTTARSGRVGGEQHSLNTSGLVDTRRLATMDMQSGNRNGESSILYFDATERRREKMRDKARTPSAQPAVAAGPLPQPSIQPVAARPAVAPTTASAPMPTVAVATVAPQAAPQPAPQPEPQAEPAGLDPKELETFLVNFVVEHTGYPPEIVELDAELEADLGIDSIKKAQLFGELGEYFDVEPSENLSLDDFPTLRHVLDFLAMAQGGTQTAAAAASIEPAAPVAPTPASTTAPPVASAPTAMAPQSEPTGLDPKELETFLVNFVVEHTGYPPEIVELDAELEADLGIDSIKKAQLFGELGEYFDVEPSENLSLDDFPTLRHVLDFLAMAQGGTTAATATPVESAAPIAPTPTPTATSTAAQPAGQSESTSLDPKELENFLVNFVVEHTGYPPEIVELDAELEADLGIDSIKKAQLFGELGEYFDVEPSENLSLDDFPTLRHVLDFLVMAQGGAA